MYVDVSRRLESEVAVTVTVDATDEPDESNDQNLWMTLGEAA